jgi:DNA recombination protein RmuC
MAMIVEILLGILIVLVVGMGIALYILLKPKADPALHTHIAQTSEYLQRELQSLRSTMDNRMSEQSRDMRTSITEQLGQSRETFVSVTQLVSTLAEKIAGLEGTNKQVIGYAEQLQSLQEMLTSPKQRGVLGEYYLENVLQNVLAPGAYQMQYAFDNGEIVDAVVFAKDKIIPVDSKFSLENYNRVREAIDPEMRDHYLKQFKADLKMRIDETSKYVRPSVGTTDFAFMFIPSEGIYYDILNGTVGSGLSARDLIDYAYGKKVIIVSPTTFLAYLQTVLQGLRALQIEESAKEIRQRVEDLGRHIKKYEEYYVKLGSALSTTVNHYNAATKELKKVDKDVLRISGESIGLDITSVDKPQEE